MYAHPRTATRRFILQLISISSVLYNTFSAVCCWLGRRKSICSVDNTPVAVLTGFPGTCRGVWVHLLENICKRVACTVCRITCWQSQCRLKAWPSITMPLNSLNPAQTRVRFVHRRHTGLVYMCVCRGFNKRQ